MGNGSSGEQNEPKRVEMIRLGHMYAIKCTTTTSSLSVLVSTSDYINFMFLISVPLPMDRIPISIPMLKPVQIRTSANPGNSHRGHSFIDRYRCHRDSVGIW